VESFNLANRPNFDIANNATFGQVITADALVESRCGRFSLD
jgi:hypothetical protein